MDQSLRSKILEAFANARKNEHIPAACCCPGPAQIRDFVLNMPVHIVRVKNTQQKQEFVKVVKNHFALTLPQALALVNSDKVVFSEFDAEYFLTKLQDAGVEFEHIKNPTGKYPKCGCGMRTVCEWAGNFYEVLNYDSSNLEKAVITLLGPVGGPYLCN